MMNYHRLSNKKKRNPYITVSLFVLVLFGILTLFNTFFSNSLTSGVHAVGKPFWFMKSTAAAGVVDLSLFFRSKKTLLEENQSLKEEVKELEIKLFSSSALIEESEKIKELHGRSVNSESILAAVLVRPNITPYDTFIIDAGEKHGVEKNNLVVVSGSVVIGYVNKVLAKTSIVTLFSSPGEKIEIAIGSEKILSTAHGQGGGNLRAYVPRGIDIFEGDHVTIPGISPKLFAVIEGIVVSPADSFQTIIFKNPVNFTQIDFVEIVKDPPIVVFPEQEEFVTEE